MATHPSIGLGDGRGIRVHPVSIHAVLEKPVNLERLAAVLTRCAAVPAPSHERLTCAEPTDRPEAAPEEALDLDDLRVRTGHDEALVAELFQDFLRHGERWSQTLLETAEAQAFGDLSPLAHRLRGALAALGARRAASAAEAVESYSFEIATGTAAADARLLLARALTDLARGLAEARAAMREYLGAVPTMDEGVSSSR